MYNHNCSHVLAGRAGIHDGPAWLGCRDNSKCLQVCILHIREMTIQTHQEKPPGVTTNNLVIRTKGTTMMIILGVELGAYKSCLFIVY